MIGHYETYVKMPPLEKVRNIAEVLGVSTDELIGTSKISLEQLKKEEALSHRLMKKFRIVEKLPVRDQKVVISLINSLAEKNRVKGKI